MKNMQSIQAIESLDDMTGIIKSELENITEGFISVGYYLRKTMDDELYKQKGYGSIYEYAKEVFGIGRSTASRFMEINQTYSIGGYSPQIEDKWRNYGSSKLTEMLGLPEEIREEVPAEATVRDIREVKGVIRDTESKYEDQMDLFDSEQKAEEAWLKKLVKEIFREEKQAFEKMVDWVRRDIGQDREAIEEDILEIVNPTKFWMVRLDTANVMLQEKCIRVMPYRGQGENEEYGYIDLAAAFEEVFYPEYPNISAPIQKVYEDVYGVSLYEPAPEKAPEKMKEVPKKVETKKTVEKPVKKEESESQPHLVNTRCEGESEEEKKVEDEQVPGQTEIAKDFPEYLPNPEENQEKSTVEGMKPEGFYKTRKSYMDSLSEEDVSNYMATVMEKLLKKMHNVSMQALATAEFWKVFYEKEVDEKGDEIECVS